MRAALASALVFSWLGVCHAGDRADNSNLPACSKEFVRAWDAFNLALSRAGPADPEPEMPPLPKKPCRLVSQNYHSYICSQEMRGCGQ